MAEPNPRPSPNASPNVTLHHGVVGAADRARLLGQRGCVAWFTGLSGSGKSTVARAVEATLAREGRLVYVLDGDNVRHGLCSDLGFSDGDRKENIRRIAEVAALFVDAGVIVLTAFISPFRADRAQARGVIGEDRFFEVHVDVPVEVCERRDPKKLYAKARRGEIRDFTGIDSPYEAPEAPALVVRTAETTVEAAAGAVVEFLRARGVLSPPPAAAGTTSGGA